MRRQTKAVGTTALALEEDPPSPSCSGKEPVVRARLVMVEVAQSSHWWAETGPRSSC